MMRWLRDARAAQVLGLLAGLFMAACPAAGSSTVTVQLLAFNDFHGQLSAPATGTPLPDLGPQVSLPTGGASHLAGLIASLRRQNPNTLVVAAGDLIGASPLTSAMFHDEPAIEVLNEMGLQYSAVGNHELDHGLAELKRMQQGGCAADRTASCRHGTFPGARFRYLAANLFDRSTGQPVFPAYAIQEVPLPSASGKPAGPPLKIAFVGAVTRSSYQLIKADVASGLIVTDEADAINATIPELRARGADAIVVLIHEGGSTQARRFDDDSCPGLEGPIVSIMARLDPAVDLVISGHTHMVYLCRVNGRLLTSAGSQGQILTAIDLTVEQRHITVTAARQLAVVYQRVSGLAAARYGEVPDSRTVRSIAGFYAGEARAAVERRIARLAGPITTQAAPSGESALGDLVADAQRDATLAAGAQIALVNSSGIRRDLAARGGWVTYGELFACQPFGNRLITLTLNGAQLHAALEHQWADGGKMLQVSEGFSYRWDPAAPVGARVAAGSMHLNGAPIEPDGLYRVTVNDFLAGGGDGFSMFASGADSTAGGGDVQALAQYLVAHAPVSAPVPQRISRVAASPLP